MSRINNIKLAAACAFAMAFASGALAHGGGAVGGQTSMSSSMAGHMGVSPVNPKPIPINPKPAPASPTRGQLDPPPPPDLSPVAPRLPQPSAPQ